MFCSEYNRQLRQSLPTFEISPSFSHRKSVAFEISKTLQMSLVLYRFVPTARVILSTLYANKNYQIYLSNNSKYTHYIQLVKAF